MAQYYIGTSGWHYDDWRGVFYPPKIPKTKWLEFYAQYFPTVELNNTFYRMPTKKAAQTWHDSTPPDFTFAIKASRYITHIKRLKGSAESVKLFMSRISPLKEKVGPLLYQLPENFKKDETRLEEFLSVLPEQYRHVLEFRNKSWFDERVYGVLKKYNSAFCIYDMPALTSPVIATADFAYVRFHGKDSMFTSKYDDMELKNWAVQIKKLAYNLKAVYIYFNNDTAGYAIENAVTIKKYLGV